MVKLHGEEIKKNLDFTNNCKKKPWILQIIVKSFLIKMLMSTFTNHTITVVKYALVMQECFIPVVT